jgi:eukaryotic-like serine/threonine-protein kinase
MTIPADVLLRKGYRLPANAEWEFACRSGTITSRYYGFSTELLPLYARYQVNSREHAWVGGSLLPNDLGLFDMLGNEFEWVNDKLRVSRPGRHGYKIDYINIIESVNDKFPRLLRGGTFNNQPANVRSANRNRNAPSNRNTNNGFRPVSTWRQDVPRSAGIREHFPLSESAAKARPPSRAG